MDLTYRIRKYDYIRLVDHDDGILGLDLSEAGFNQSIITNLINKILSGVAPKRDNWPISRSV